MIKITAPVVQGLRFNQRDYSFERLLNLSLSGPIGTLSSRRKHKVLYALPAAPGALIHHTNGFTYTICNDNGFYANSILVDTGYGLPASFAITVPNLTYSQQYLFIATSIKMRKINLSNHAVSNWGIAAPTLPLGVGGAFESRITISNAEALTGWTATGSGTSIASEATIKTEGVASIKLSTGSAESTLVFTPASPIALSNISDNDFLYFQLRISNPSESVLTSVSVRLSFAADNFASNTASFTLGMEGTGVGTPLESQYTGAHGAWKEIRISLRQLTGKTGFWHNLLLHQFGLVIVSTAAIDVYIDNVRILIAGPDGSIGHRWAYRYKNSVTGATSNLSPATNPPLFTGRQSQVLTGFVISTDPQVDFQEVFRDTNGNGIFQLVPIAKANTNLDFGDTVPTNELGEVDLNDNAVPMPATLIAIAGSRMWINDVSTIGRVWRSKPGRFESMSEFFTLGTQDPITFMGTVGGQFCIITTNSIIRVVDPDSDTPSFSPIADIGGLSPTGATLRSDEAIISHSSGLFLFNGSTLQPMPFINTLYDTVAVVDDRAIHQHNVNNIILGSSDTRVWITYLQRLGNYVTYAHDLVSNEWTEESDILFVHDTGHLSFNHIAADSLNRVVSLYDGGDFESGLHITQLLDLAKPTRETMLETRDVSIGRVRDFGIEYISYQDSTIELFVDEVSRSLTVLPAAFARTWNHTNLDAIGKRLAWKLNFSNYIQIFNAEWWLASMSSDILSFDTGEVFVSPELFIPIEIIIQFFAHKPLFWQGILYIDNQPQQGDFYESTNGPVYRRYNLRPYPGRAARFTLRATELFSPIAFTLGVTGFGDGVPKSVGLYPRAV